MASTSQSGAYHGQMWCGTSPPTMEGWVEINCGFKPRAVFAVGGTDHSLIVWNEEMGSSGMNIIDVSGTSLADVAYSATQVSSDQAQISEPDDATEKITGFRLYQQIGVTYYITAWG